MDAIRELWRTQTLLVEPSASGRGEAAEVKERSGTPLASSDADGTLSDESGAVLLRAPLRERGRERKPADVGIVVADGNGRPVGEARVVRYRLGPRARSITVAIKDAAEGDAGRLEPRDRKGEQLAVRVGDSEVATVAVEAVKRGLLRKSRVYRADIVADVPEPLRPLVLASVIRYDAMLKAVMAASTRD